MTTEPTRITAKTLRQALEFFLEDDNYVDRMEADGLKELILKDGRVSAEERGFLEEALKQNNFDGRALTLLESLLKDGR